LLLKFFNPQKSAAEIFFFFFCTPHRPRCRAKQMFLIISTFLLFLYALTTKPGYNSKQHIKNGIISSVRRFLKRWQRPRNKNKKRRIDNKKALIEFDRIHIKIPVAAATGRILFFSGERIFSRDIRWEFFCAV
jgi:hypothetical protein